MYPNTKDLAHPRALFRWTPPCLRQHVVVVPVVPALESIALLAGQELPDWVPRVVATYTNGFSVAKVSSWLGATSRYWHSVTARCCCSTCNCRLADCAHTHTFVTLSNMVYTAGGELASPSTAGGGVIWTRTQPLARSRGSCSKASRTLRRLCQTILVVWGRGSATLSELVKSSLARCVGHFNNHSPQFCHIAILRFQGSRVALPHYAPKRCWCLGSCALASLRRLRLPELRLLQRAGGVCGSVTVCILSGFGLGAHRYLKEKLRIVGMPVNDRGAMIFHLFKTLGKQGSGW